MSSFVAVKLNKITLPILITSFSADNLSSFMHALLTSAYNGENWYYVYELGVTDRPVDFTKMIMTEEKLKKLYRVPELTNDHWFTAIPF